MRQKAFASSSSGGHGGVSRQAKRQNLSSEPQLGGFNEASWSDAEFNLLLSLWSTSTATLSSS